MSLSSDFYEIILHKSEILPIIFEEKNSGFSFLALDNPDEEFIDQLLVTSTRLTTHSAIPFYKLPYCSVSTFEEYCSCTELDLHIDNIKTTFYITNIPITHSKNNRKYIVKIFHVNEHIEGIIPITQHSHRIKTDLQGNITYCDTTYLDAIESIPEHVIGKNALELILPESHQSCINAVRQCFQNPNETHFTHLKKPHPKVIEYNSYWEFSCIVDDSTHSVVGIQCSCVYDNISFLSQNINHKALHKFVTLANDTPILIGIVSIDGFCRFVNSKWEHVTSTKFIDNIGFGWLQSFSKKSQEELFAVLAQLRENDNHIVRTELELLDSSNENQTFIFSFKKVIDDDITNITFSASNITDIKKEEKRVRQQYEFAEKIFNVSLDMQAIASPEGFFIKVNKQFEKLLGYSIDELYGKAFIEFIHPEDRDTTIKVMSRLSKEEDITNFVNRYITINGDYKYLEWSAVNINNLYYASARDITDKIKSENKLLDKQNELERLNLFLEKTNNAAKIGSWEVLMETGEIWWSATTREIHEVPDWFTPVLDTALSFYKEGYYRELITKKFTESIEFGTQYELELLIITYTGKEKWVKAIGQVVKNDEGKVVKAIGTFQDIDAEKKLRLALIASEERWKFALEGSGDGIWDWDAVNNTVFFSDQWKKMLGYESTDIGNTLDEWSSRVHPEDLNACYNDLQRHITGQVPFYLNEHRMLCKDGTYKWILDRGKVVEWLAPGKPKRLIGTHSDITRVKNYQDELVRLKEIAESANNAKSMFLANMSHEIRTPLNAVIGYTELLRRMPLTSTQSEYMNGIAKSSILLLSLLNDVLDFSKIEARKLELSLEETDILKIVEDLCDIFTIKALEKNIDLYLDYDFDIPEIIIADGLRLKQILSNLLSNAIKFTHRGSIEVKVSLEYYEVVSKEACLHFSVKDSGIGIEEEARKKIFDAFTQADSSTTKKFGGSGLGLSISSELLALMNSSFDLQTEIGKGSTFSFSLTVPVSTSRTIENYNRNNNNFIQILTTINDQQTYFWVEKLCKHNNVDYVQAELDSLETLKLENTNKNHVLFVADQLLTQEKVQQLRNTFSLTFSKVQFLYLSELSQAENCAYYDFCLIKPIKPSSFEKILTEVQNQYSNTFIPESNASILLGNNHEHISVQSLEDERLTILKAHFLIVDDNDINLDITENIIHTICPQATVKKASDGLEALDLFRDNTFELVFMDLQMPNLNGFDATVGIRDIEILKGRKSTAIIGLTAATVASELQQCLLIGMNEVLQKPIEFNAIKKCIYSFLVDSNGTAQHSPNHDENQDESEVLFDINEFRNSVSSDSALIELFLKNFMESLEIEVLPALESAIKNNNQQQWSSLLHKTKGSAGNLRLKALFTFIKKLEEASFVNSKKLLREMYLLTELSKKTKRYLQVHKYLS